MHMRKDKVVCLVSSAAGVAAIVSLASLYQLRQVDPALHLAAQPKSSICTLTQQVACEVLRRMPAGTDLCVLLQRLQAEKHGARQQLEAADEVLNQVFPDYYSTHLMSTIAIDGLNSLKPVLLPQGADQTADAIAQAQLQVRTSYYRKSCHVLRRVLSAG